MFEYFFSKNQSTNTKDPLYESELSGFVIIDNVDEKYKNIIKKNIENGDKKLDFKWSRNESGRLVKMQIV